MPYKTVSQPRLVASLEGEVTGGSFNRKLGSIVMVGKNPVQVAVVAQSGNPSKVFGVKIDDASDVAILARNMAVVNENGNLWGLLDIEHAAKIDQVGRDCRMMVGQGEAALALKWDNSCDQLTPGRSEIAVRNFTLRGDTRAVDVGDTECYTVVDGGEGEFRIHPGSTPEQGSTAKTGLPPGCKNLDRLRGGKFLSAIYRRNDPTVCLIKRAGNRLEPRMIKLDVPVTDVAVAETSLLVGTKDGRVIVYDGEAIDKSTASLIQAKGERDLGSRGEVRVLLVAGGSLFVGTSSGEIYLTALVRKQAIV
jgi:hypothetical protein